MQWETPTFKPVVKIPAIYWPDYQVLPTADSCHICSDFYSDWRNSRVSGSLVAVTNGLISNWVLEQRLKIHFREPVLSVNGKANGKNCYQSVQSTVKFRKYTTKEHFSFCASSPLQVWARQSVLSIDFLAVTHQRNQKRLLSLLVEK